MSKVPGAKIKEAKGIGCKTSSTGVKKMCSSKPQEVSATAELNSGLEVQVAGFR